MGVFYAHPSILVPRRVLPLNDCYLLRLHGFNSLPPPRSGVYPPRLTFTRLSDTLDSGGVVRKPRGSEELIFIEEVASRFAEGKSLEQIYLELNWPYERVRQLANTSEFEAFLEKESPARLDAWRDSKSAASSEKLRDLASANKEDYVRELDKLARNATNENVKYNALIALLKFAGESDEALQPVEIIEWPNSAIDNFWKRWNSDSPN